MRAETRKRILDVYKLGLIGLLDIFMVVAPPLIVAANFIYGDGWWDYMFGVFFLLFYPYILYMAYVIYKDWRRPKPKLTFKKYEIDYTLITPEGKMYRIHTSVDPKQVAYSANAMLLSWEMEKLFHRLADKVYDEERLYDVRTP